MSNGSRLLLSLLCLIVNQVALLLTAALTQITHKGTTPLILAGEAL